MGKRKSASSSSAAPLIDASGFNPKAARRGALVGVLGLGRSGQSAARLLLKKNFKVLGSDTRPKAELTPALKSLPKAIKWEWSGHSERLLKCAFVVKSPGVKPDLPIFNKLREKHIPVFSELEIALAYSKAKAVVEIGRAHV